VISRRPKAMGENVSNVIRVIRRVLLSKRLPACAFVQFVIDAQMNENMVKNGYQYYIMMMPSRSRGFGDCGGYRARPSATLPSPVKNSHRDTATVRSTTTLPRVCLEPALYIPSIIPPADHKSFFLLPFPSPALYSHDLSIR
jgi:hypothetical protein